MALDESIRSVVAEKLSDSAAQEFGPITPRTLHRPPHLEGKVSAVIGMRRAGKTTFLHELRRVKAEHQPLSQLPYFNFEDERLGQLKAADLGFLIESHARVFGPPAGRTTWFLDEVQLVDGWEQFVRRMLDTGTVDLFVTGSSAQMLSREVKTALRGRVWEVLIHPFSFTEVLRHQGVSVPESPYGFSSAVRSEIERRFIAFLEFGGFPEVQGRDAYTRAQLLRDYVDVAILRDVVERHEVRNPTSLRWIVRHLLANAAGLFSANRFYRMLKSQGIAVSKDTVHEFVSHLEDCFLVRTIEMESDSERQRMVNPRKAYPIDTGLIPIYDRSGRANTGHALETAVLLELERRHQTVTYLKTGNGYEVDFVARSSTGEVTLIQVAAEAVTPETRDRELRALVDGSERFPKASLLLLTLTRDGLPRSLPDSVVGMPAYEWMLAIPDTPA